jgi:DNA polymerase-3 subunit epsilon
MCLVMTISSWHSGSLLGFDTETTGVDTANDRIVTAAVVDGDDVRTWTIDPGVDIPAEASAVHGITTEQARATGIEPRLALAEIAGEIHRAAVTGVPVVAYRAGFDLTLLSHELERHGLPQPEWERLHVIDPLVLDKRCDRYRRGKRTLAAACGHYGVELVEAHSAAADALACVGLARVIGQRYPDVAAMACAELHLAQVGWHAEDAASLEAYFRRQGRVESVERRWPLAREFAKSTI